MITAALNFYASGSFQGSTRDMCGVSQSTVPHCIKEVTNGLLRRAGDYVHYRTDPESQSERAIGFGAIAGFRQVQESASYKCVPTSWEAATTHSYFGSLRCHIYFTPPARLQGWILGDKGYSLRKWLLTPVRNPSNDVKERYTTCHDSTIEQAIGMLKMCFCCLNRSSGALQYAPQKFGCIVLVCCILRNIALQRLEALPEEDMWEYESSFDEQDTEGTQGQAAMNDLRRVMEGRHLEQHASEVFEI
ncbi:putative nuclease HARBI1 [Heterodontus francisci]|uniref:putative nuclease HARBI1 n=1 Tax=Heterodontus francisci TaxID=7792 RepID=UPI00355AE9CF